MNVKGLSHSFSPTYICVHGTIYKVTKIIIICIAIIGGFAVFLNYFKESLYIYFFILVEYNSIVY